MRWTKKRGAGQELLCVAGPLDHVGVPQSVHVRPFVEEPDLGSIPALVAVVADMGGLMKILDAVDEES